MMMAEELEVMKSLWGKIKRAVELAFASGMNCGVDPRGAECREKIIKDLRTELFGDLEPTPVPLAREPEETCPLSEADKQKAKIMLLHGTPEQQWDAAIATGVIPVSTPKTEENVKRMAGMMRDFKMIQHCLGEG